MPELPEVETIKNDLRKKILNVKIIKVDIRLNKIVKNSTLFFVKTIENNSITKIERRGKLIIFYLNNNLFLLVHLKMTGQLIYIGKDFIVGGHSQTGTINNLPNKYSHVIFIFKDNSKLIYNDVRQFGYLEIVNKEELEKRLLGFGVEPLSRDFTFKKIKKILYNKKTNIKAFLLNQKYIAGIGNIYADEILFAAGVSPKRKTSSLKEKEIQKIFNATKEILKKAIKYRGTTFNDYRDAEGKKGKFFKMLKVYGRENEKCLDCQEVIKKIKVAGRGTRICEKCQK